MTISTTTNRYSYAGNGVTTAFSYASKFLANGDLVVLKVVDATGVSTTQVLDTDYTVTGAGVANGGTVTMTTAPASGTTLVIYGDPTLTQSLDLVNNDAFDADDIEEQLDRQVLVSQRQADLIDRSFRLADSDTSGLSLELSNLEANQIVGVNSAGDALEGKEAIDLGLTVVSSFMGGLLDDSTAAEARTTLGAVGLTGDETVAGIKTFTSLPTFSAPALPVAGRLTLTSGTPVTSSDVTGATTVYFTPYKGNALQLFDGTNWSAHEFSELSQATTDTTKSPAAVANNSNYDIFVWNDSGTLRATRGPAWTSDTARGTGAGTTELELLEGRYVNKVAITNGPAAQRGLYVGTIRSDGSAQINDQRGGAGGTARRNVWNYYNRVLRDMFRGDTADSWTYATDSWQASNNSTANSCSYVVGLAEDAICATHSRYVVTAGASAGSIGVGVDSSTANSAQYFPELQPSLSNQLTARYTGVPSGVGLHTIYAIERVRAAGTVTYFGDNGLPNNNQYGISVEVMA